MFADSGMALLPDTLAAKQGGLSPDEKAEVQRAPLVAVRNILRENLQKQCLYVGALLVQRCLG
jgi:hypothetical protein